MIENVTKKWHKMANGGSHCLHNFYVKYKCQHICIPKFVLPMKKYQIIDDEKMAQKSFNYRINYYFLVVCLSL